MRIRCRRSFFDWFESVFQIFLTVFVQILEVIHRFFDVKDLVVLAFENVCEVFEESVVETIFSVSWSELLSVACSAYGAFTQALELR